jgi:iduronate 2-sulfatase
MPQRFWDLYNTSDIALSEQKVFGGFEQFPVYSWTSFNGNPARPAPDEEQRLYRQGYYASVSFVDYEIGRLLAGLDAVGAKDNTLVVLFGDHGWELGEHGCWSKSSLWETSARVPLIFKAPWLGPASRGKETFALAELVDVYKTVADLAGLPPPETGVEGTSLAPIVRDPETTEVKEYAFSAIPRCNTTHDQTPWLDKHAEKYWLCHHSGRKNYDFMGYTVRSADWRYVEWRSWDGIHLDSDFSQPPLGVELYDHRSDAHLRGDAYWDHAEYENLAGRPEFVGHVRVLSAALKNNYYRRQT